jgi:hypothetical protein
LVRLIPVKRVSPHFPQTCFPQTRGLTTLCLPLTSLPLTSLPLGGRSLGGITSLRLAKQFGSGGRITREGGPFRREGAFQCAELVGRRRPRQHLLK